MSQNCTLENTRAKEGDSAEDPGIRYQPVTLFEKWLMAGSQPIGLFQVNLILREDSKIPEEVMRSLRNDWMRRTEPPAFCYDLCGKKQ